MTREQAMPAPMPAIVTAAEADEAIRRLNETVDALEQLFEQEGAHARAGRLVEVVQLAPRKDELARAYLANTQRLKACLPRLRGELGDALIAVKARHADFHARLQVNLTVLATAHAVSEGIVRGLSQELTRKTTPQVYGASGRQTNGGGHNTGPLAVSRAL